MYATTTSGGVYYHGQTIIMEGNGSRRRLSRARATPASKETNSAGGNHQQRHRRNHRKINDSNSASLISKLVGAVGKALMRGLWEDENGSSSSGGEDNEDSIHSKTEASLREHRRESALSDFLENPHTSEDVLANEGDFSGGGGAHIPFIFPHQRKHVEPRRSFELIEGNGEPPKKAVRFSFCPHYRSYA